MCYISISTTIKNMVLGVKFIEGSQYGNSELVKQIYYNSC